MKTQNHLVVKKLAIYNRHINTDIKLTNTGKLQNYNISKAHGFPRPMQFNTVPQNSDNCSGFLWHCSMESAQWHSTTA